eukprot:m.311380 g.311380  ORF g.311380 m.311380 type:complete len:233 (-) comp27448_c0_seq1:15-713(-)
MPAPPLLTAGIYVIGTTLLFPGTILLLPTAPADAGTAAIAFLLAACSCLTVAALIDLHDAVTARAAVIPHLPMSTLIVPVCMLIGGVFFLAGSALYWPAWAGEQLGSTAWTVARFGTWVFRTGTCAYLTGSFVSLPGVLAEVKTHTRGDRARNAQFALGGVLSYIVGAALYFGGGVLSEASHPAPGAWAWAVGSGWFVLGALLLLLASASAPVLDEEQALLVASTSKSTISS